MSTKKRVVSAVLAAAVGVSLLCGFGVAKKDYVYQQFETAEPVTSVTVKDASAKVTIRAADTDHITRRERQGDHPGGGHRSHHGAVCRAAGRGTPL